MVALFDYCRLRKARPTNQLTDGPPLCRKTRCAQTRIHRRRDDSRTGSAKDRRHLRPLRSGGTTSGRMRSGEVWKAGYLPSLEESLKRVGKKRLNAQRRTGMTK